MRVVVKYEGIKRCFIKIVLSMSEQEVEDYISTGWTFKYVVEGIFMTAISLFGLFGNSLSIYILRHKEVKLHRVFVEVLCSLSVFDNLFLIGAFLLYSLPQLCVTFADYQFHYIAPYLYPITNTLLTCSSYMTVAVAVNRYLLIEGITHRRSIKHLNNGYKQAFAVLLVAASVNIPRWLEFSCCKYITVTSNITVETSGEASTINNTMASLILNPIRDKYEYVRDYTLISSNVLTLLLPMMLMSLFSGLVYREMAKSTTLTSGDLNDNEEGEQAQRNRSLTYMLIGIIVLFIVCRIGELGISIYELVMMIRNERRVDFPGYVRAIISINTLLLVCNSSLNFIIYYKDLLFRMCVLKVYSAVCAMLGKKQKKIHAIEEITLQDI